ncbi:MAG TPA: lysophospholipid acyltransferase family protein [bacterium]|nr:lysophospholipid acyltransferase family protein [bacterium]
MVYSLSRLLLRLLLRMGFGFRVEGRGHEPEAGPVVVVSNHLSDLDPLVVGSALRRRVTFMAKHELFQIPGVRWWVTACGAFPVRRGAPDRQALRTALAILHGGGIVVMFPEGTRGWDRTLRDPEPGAALLARRTGAALLPVAILGTDMVLPRDAHRLHRGRITVRIGPPLHVGPPSRDDGRRSAGRDDLDAIGRRFMGEIARLLA